MAYFYLKFSLSLLLLLAAPVLLIRAQPYDDHELRALLMPEGCPQPCFMGIRPGVTARDEAVRLLGASGWVQELNDQYFNAADWRWTDSAPPFIEHTGFGLIEYPGGIIYHMKVLLTVPMIEMMWALGEPTQVLSEAAPTDASKQIYFFWYPSRGLALQTVVEACAAPMVALTNTETVLYLYSAQSAEVILSNVKAYPDFLDILLSRLNSRRFC